MRIPIIAAALCLFTSPLPAQQLQRYPWQDWPVVQAIPMKKLPPGLFHFTPVSADLAAQRFDGGKTIACRESYDDPDNPGALAISFALMMKAGELERNAIDRMDKAHASSLPCGYNHFREYEPVAISLRDASHNNRVFLLKVRDTVSGHFLYIGWPQ
jgi:hypothetical protein